VIDAGIATEANLELIKEKGYNYLCVSRTRLSDYELSISADSVTVYDACKRPVSLHEIQTPQDGDYYLQITSPTKKMKEASMNRRFKESFEGELARISHALTTKGGTKNYEKVIERIGRAKEKYPSIAKHYEIDYQRSSVNSSQMETISWSIKQGDDPDQFSGVYFLRTNIRTLDEKTTWDYYNLIREIECTNRQLKNDLNLRPIYHRKDERSDAHIFFGLLAYWIVNTIRYQLKQKGENCYWTEIVRRMSTQKAVTTQAVNALGENVETRICSIPQKKAQEIYNLLGYRKIPFRKMKICSTHPPS
jgi:transposase